MKKTTLFALILTGLFANAQEGTANKGLQGAWFATSQFGYQNTDNGGGSSSTNLLILPVAGTFVTPSVAVGAGVGYINIKKEVASATAAKSNLYVIQPLVRKYWNVTGGLYFFGQMAAPIIFGSETVSSTDISQYGLAASGGLDFFVSKHFSVEFSYLLANLSMTKVGNNTTTTNFALASVASVDPVYTSMLGASNGGLITPLSFGFKFVF